MPSSLAIPTWLLQAVSTFISSWSTSPPNKFNQKPTALCILSDYRVSHKLSHIPRMETNRCPLPARLETLLETPKSIVRSELKFASATFRCNHQPTLPVAKMWCFRACCWLVPRFWLVLFRFQNFFLPKLRGFFPQGKLGKSKKETPLSCNSVWQWFILVWNIFSWKTEMVVWKGSVHYVLVQSSAIQTF